ncbi:MAG: sigma-70 family RNA polymerase sigma factor [Acidobacteriota bacterium]
MLATATHLKVVPGQSDQLENLFREHSDRIFRAAYRITGTVVDAEDVVQTIFLRLARRQDGANLEPNPASYLHRAAVNASLDLIRQRSRSDSVPLEEMSELSTGSHLSPEAQQRSRELRRIIQNAIGDLGEKTAEMFILRYFEGYDNHEIADMLGTSQVLVGVLLHRARTKMKKQITKVLEGGNEKN